MYSRGVSDSYLPVVDLHFLVFRHFDCKIIERDGFGGQRIRAGDLVVALGVNDHMAMMRERAQAAAARRR